MNNHFLDIIKTRRSCRKYSAEQITDQELAAVLEAGTYAPTSRGLQSPFIVAVQQKELRELLAVYFEQDVSHDVYDRVDGERYVT